VRVCCFHFFLCCRLEALKRGQVALVLIFDQDIADVFVVAHRVYQTVTLRRVFRGIVGADCDCDGVIVSADCDCDGVVVPVVEPASWRTSTGPAP